MERPTGLVDSWSDHRTPTTYNTVNYEAENANSATLQKCNPK